MPNRMMFIPSLQPPIEPDIVPNDSGVNATIYQLEPVAINAADVSLAVNPASVTLVGPSIPLSPTIPLI